ASDVRAPQTTNSDRAVAPAPVSTAARTDSFEGRQNEMLRFFGSTPSGASCSSNSERVPEPRSRKIQFVSVSSRAFRGGYVYHGCELPTTITSRSLATVRFD